jgi:SAM-dependent methyltransferase
MIIDIAYKWARKSMAGTFYRGFSNSFLGRAKAYETPETYRSIFEFYKGSGLPIQDKIILEIGPGNQFFTALLLKQAGAKCVILVDPKITLEKAAEDFAKFGKGTMDEKLFRENLFCFTSLKDIPAEWNDKIDLAFSHNVLEHFNELPDFFSQSHRLLKPGGSSFHRVDLSDHTYHIFAKYGFTRGILKNRMLYHLRYSDRLFERINDPKCYMNRMLLPTYFALAQATGLKARTVASVSEPSIAVHSDLRKKNGNGKEDDFRISSFSLLLTKQSA